ncbi:MAG: SUMF1/EgtB/PvdO family nonheme iron enzyme [Deltaproteobacteria bacterium]|nr:SUMF1/EgtB/PvdO family nonheme iron enzyme [Deltaproteobacteria bacterium]
MRATALVRWVCGGALLALAACAPRDSGPLQPCDVTPLPDALNDVLPIDAQVQLRATFYVFRGGCPAPGAEDSADPVSTDGVDVQGGVVEFSVAVPFREVMRPPLGPRAEYCARVVYTAAGPEQDTGHWSAWKRAAFDGLRVGHQDSVQPFRLRPYGSDCVTLGSLQGGGADADPALFDADHDGIPNLRELQLALRPTQPDSLQLVKGDPPEPRERRLAAVNAPFGMDPGPDAGAFASEGPARTLAVGELVVDETEVTNRQYRVCMGLPGPAVDGGVGWACAAPKLMVYENAEPRLVSPAFARHPVVGVSQEQAARFCAARGARLPTEVEWERAARVDLAGAQGPDTPYPWGFFTPDLVDGHNDCALGVFTLYSGDLPIPCDGSSRQDAAAVITPQGDLVRAAQNNGLVDLAGNVAEWTADHYTRDLHEWLQTQAPPYVNPDGGHLFSVRGGSFRSGVRFVRTYARAGVDDEASTYEETLRAVGFRCVR